MNDEPSAPFGMPRIERNIEGLRKHATFNTLFGGSELTAAQRKWRAWLVHCLVKASRHYNEARRLLLAQRRDPELPPDQWAENGQFPIFDLSFEIEDCITALSNALICLDALSKKQHWNTPFLASIQQEKKEIIDLRNVQEHMHQQIAAGQTGDGPDLSPELGPLLQ